ncbi:MAG: flagellar export chaperone FliS, partial [Deltaproteobacteria bacterium]|nr:flagellar export chaperone FliS [Deltaproteobacteria bacterium]
LNLVVMCYNAAISNLKMAKTRLEEKKYEEKAKALKKFLEIIGELMAALNFEKGGDIAKNLNAIYAYIYRSVSQGDIRKDTKPFEEAIGILEELRDAWEEIGRPRAQHEAEKPQYTANGAAVRS